MLAEINLQPMCLPLGDTAGSPRSQVQTRITAQLGRGIEPFGVATE